MGAQSGDDARQRVRCVRMVIHNKNLDMRIARRKHLSVFHATILQDFPRQNIRLDWKKLETIGTLCRNVRSLHAVRRIIQIDLSNNQMETTLHTCLDYKGAMHLLHTVSFIPLPDGTPFRAH